MLLGSVAAAACGQGDSGLRMPIPQRPIERALPVTVIDNALEPLAGVHVVSSVGDAIVDHQVTDADGQVTLSVAFSEGALVSIHDVQPDAFWSQSVAVLPEEESLEVRFRLPPSLERRDVSIELDVTGIPDDSTYEGTLVATGYSPFDAGQLENGSQSYDFSTWGCPDGSGGQTFSIHGHARDAADRHDRAKWLHAAGADLAFETTAATLAFVSDEGRPVTVEFVGSAPQDFVMQASSVRCGLVDGTYAYPALTSSATTYVLGWNSDMEAIHLFSVWPDEAPAGWFIEWAFVPAETESWTIDTLDFPPSLSEHSVSNLDGRIVLAWHASDGDADIAQIAAWSLFEGVWRRWLFLVPPSSGTSSLEVPPIPATLGPPFQPSDFGIRYIDYEGLSGFLAARDTRAAPNYYVMKQSVSDGTDLSLFPRY